MSLQEKILLRKIKKREKNRQKLVQLKESERENDKSNVNEDENEETPNKKRKFENNTNKVASHILTETTFASFKDKLSEATLKAVDEMGFAKLTEIQEKTLPTLLEGKNLMAAAKTGSGKTLAFLIAAIEFVHHVKYKTRNGTGVIIISPTRELAMQTYGVLIELMKYHHNTYGLVMGGANRQTEVQKLSRGTNILVATPGRLLDHMQNTPDFIYKNVLCLIIDEADLILDIGFEVEMRKIVELLPAYRQTVLFSATQNEKTKALASLVYKTEPVCVGIDDPKTISTVSGLQQSYAVCPSEKRLILLFNWLKKGEKRKDKIMVFFNSCMSVKYHKELFTRIGLKTMAVHGKQKQNLRTRTFFKFCNATHGILLCTDIAARGLDIPVVDWIVQYDPPNDPKEYIHRVGRTARGEGGRGQALLIIRPEEEDFLDYLQVPLNACEFLWDKMIDIQQPLEKLLSDNHYIRSSAIEAYKGYVRAFQSHSLKNVFDIQKLDLKKVSLSFGLRVQPSMDSSIPNQRHSSFKKKFNNFNKNTVSNGNYNKNSAVFNRNERCY